jgi:ABC-2 type transport system ATP-binding protein
MDARERSVEVRRHTSYLPGELRLPERVTARGFLSHLGRLRGGVPEKEIDRLSERIGLEPERHIGDLSKGNKQKVGIVAAWMHDPDLLILDEPTSGLDPLRQHDVQEMMRERAAAGRTVFLSSHELDQVEHVADRVGIIRDGRMVAVEAVSDLKERRVRQVEIRFIGEVPTDELRRLPGVTDVVAKGDRVRVRVEGSMDPLIKALANHQVQTLTSEEPELEDIFLSYYDGRGGER